MRLASLVVAALVASVAQAQAPNITITSGDLNLDLVIGEGTSRAFLLGNDGTAALTYRIRTDGDGGRAVVYALSDYYTRKIYGIDPGSGEVLSEVATTAVGYPAFDGGRLFVLNGTTLETVDPETGQVTASVTVQFGSSGTYYDIVDVAAANGQIVVAVWQGDGTSRLDVFDTTTGSRVRSIALTLAARTVAAGGGTFYVTGQDPSAGNVLVALDAVTGNRTRTSAFPQVRSLTFSRTSNALLALAEGSDRTVRLYDAMTLDYLSTFNLPAPNGYNYYAGLAADEGREVPWLRVSPRSGTVSAGGEVGATLSVNTSRLVAGTYRADVVVESNDPDTPEVVLPVMLVAIGAPDIVVVPEAVAFGASYVGTPLVRPVTVRNSGSDTLRVSATTVSDDRLAASVDAFELLPRDSVVVDLTLTPTGAGELDATLTFATNVEGRESVVVTVTGTDAFPPVLAVSPASLDVNGAAGAVATATLTVSNDGDGPLVYSIATGLTSEVIPSRTTDTFARMAASVAPARRTAEEARAGRSVAPAAGVGEVQLFTLATDREEAPVVNLLEVRGAVEADSLYLAFDLDVRPRWISAYAQLDLDTDPSTGSMYDRLGIDAEVAVQAYYDEYTGRYDGVVYVVTWNGPIRYEGASWALRDSSLYAAVPLSALPGLGRAFDAVFLTEAEIVTEYGYSWGYDWAPNEGIVAVSVAPWLSTDPEEGEVAAGASADVTVSLDATDLNGGVYESVVVVEGNGPEPQVARVPVTFDVTGVPAATAEALAFGQVFVGYPSARTLIIENSGTDDLAVTAITADDAAVVATLPEGLVLRPGSSAQVPVRVTAMEVGAVETTLAVMSNAPDSPLTVAVTAAAVEPPVMEPDATALTVEARRGETTEAVLRLHNRGGSPLTLRPRVAARSVSLNARVATAAENHADGPVALGGALRAAAREAALRRTGSAAVRVLPATGDLPTLLIDPDEGLETDLVEVRGETDTEAEVLAVDLVFARPLDTYQMSGQIFFDTDQRVSTGERPYLSDGTRPVGAEVVLDLYSVRYGDVWAYQSVPPYGGEYLPVRVEDRSLRFDVPLSYVGRDAFDFVGEMSYTSPVDRFPDTGVASVDARLGWLTILTDAEAVPAGDSLDLRLGIDVDDLPIGTYEAALLISMNDPAQPVLRVPVTLTAVAGVATESGAVDGFVVSPPAPNPTRGGARLGYTLPEAADVHVEVFDTVGRQVLVQEVGARVAGAHTVDLPMEGMPAGIYAVRVRAGDRVAVHRLSVVR